jgi:hypothetical protein
MDNSQTYVNGFLQGWSSVVGLRLDNFDIPAPRVQASGSNFIHRLMEGIAAAKKQIADVK